MKVITVYHNFTEETTASIKHPQTCDTLVVCVLSEGELQVCMTILHG